MNVPCLSNLAPEQVDGCSFTKKMSAERAVFRKEGKYKATSYQQHLSLDRLFMAFISHLGTKWYQYEEKGEVKHHGQSNKGGWKANEKGQMNVFSAWCH